MGRKPPKPPGRRSRPRFKQKRSRALKGARDLLRQIPTMRQAAKTITYLDRYGHSGAAIMGVTYLDHFLGELLREHFVELTKDQRERLFDTSRSGVLGTFSAKALFGYALGLYGSAVLHDLQLMNGIRNAFAHAHARLSFRNKQIKADCQKLRTLRIWWKLRGQDDFPFSAEFQIFTETVLVLCAKLMANCEKKSRAKQHVGALTVAATAMPDGLFGASHLDRDFLF